MRKKHIRGATKNRNIKEKIDLVSVAKLKSGKMSATFPKTPICYLL